jgi:hypothetical protein
MPAERKRGRTRGPGLTFALIVMAGLVGAAGPAPTSAAPTSPAPIAPGPLGDRDVTIANRSEHPIVELYVSPASTDSWGDDRLGDDVLDVGRKKLLPLGRLRDCGFDVLAVYDDATREEVHGINLCRTRQVVFDGSHAAALPLPPAPEQHVTVVDASPLPIQQLYISPPDAAQWGDDLLAVAAMSVGEERALTFHGTCLADVRIVFANRAAEERRGLDLCKTPVLRIVPGWTTADRPDDPR